MPDDSFMNRIAREVTQEFIKGARWVGDQGMQAWRNYWNKPTPGPAPFDPVTQQSPPYFPPTHGHQSTVSPSTSEQVHVSIYDLQRLLDAEGTKSKNALSPLATFQAPLGCSFLSFSPSGLQLATVSKKGDYHFVWDLMRMRQGKASLTSGSGAATAPAAGKVTSGPHVRQIALFTRMTVANVVDIVWTEPKGNVLAVLTEKGTVHLFELPPSAFQWPPPRRVHRAPEAAKQTGTEEHPERPTGLAAVSSAMQAINGKTRPFIAAVRTRGASNGSGFPTLSSLSITPAVGAKSGKAVAAGLTKSIGAATDSVNSFRHAGDNKLHLHSLTNGVTPGCVRWMTGRDRGYIAIVAGGILRIYQVKRKPASGKAGTPNSVVASKTKSVEFVLPPIPDALLAPAVLAAMNTSDPSDSIPSPFTHVPIVTGHWTLREPPPSTSTQPSPLPRPRPHYLSYAEIDSNPPYQPFHTDRRVTLIATDESLPIIRQITGEDPEPWVFGQDIPGTRLTVSAGPSGSGSSPPRVGGAAAGLDDGDGDDDDSDDSEQYNVDLFAPGKSTVVLRAAAHEEEPPIS